MASYNSITLVGNLTRDPELRYTPKGTAVTTVGLAVNRTWKDEAGVEKEEVLFVDVKMFGRRAETLAQYLKKGSPALFVGRLHLETWEDKNDGNRKRSKHVVIADECQFLSGGNRGQGEARAGDGAPDSERVGDDRKIHDSDVPDGIPF